MRDDVYEFEGVVDAGWSSSPRTGHFTLDVKRRQSEFRVRDDEALRTLTELIGGEGDKPEPVGGATVARLLDRVSDLESTVRRLSTVVDSLNEQMAGVQDALAEPPHTDWLEEPERLHHPAYYLDILEENKRLHAELDSLLSWAYPEEDPNAGMKSEPVDKDDLGHSVSKCRFCDDTWGEEEGDVEVFAAVRRFYGRGDCE